MIVFLIILVILTLIFFILLTPIIIEVDLERLLCMVRIWGIGSARLIVRDLRIGVQLNILGWEKIIIFGKTNKQVETSKKALRKNISRSTLKKMPRRIWALISSFRIQFFYLDIDTDNYLANAWLYPIAVMISQENRQIKINFRGEVEFRLKIQNNLQRMLRAFLFT